MSLIPIDAVKSLPLVDRQVCPPKPQNMAFSATCSVFGYQECPFLESSFLLQQETFLSMQRTALVPGPGAQGKPRALSFWRHLFSPIAPYALGNLESVATVANGGARDEDAGGRELQGRQGSSGQQESVEKQRERENQDWKEQQAANGEHGSTQRQGTKHLLGSQLDFLRSRDKEPTPRMQMLDPRMRILQALEVPWSTALFPLELTLRRWRPRPSADLFPGPRGVPTSYPPAAPLGAYVLLLTPQTEGGEALAVPLHGFKRGPLPASASPSGSPQRAGTGEGEGKGAGKGGGVGTEERAGEVEWEEEALQVAVSWDGLPPAPGQQLLGPPPHSSTLFLLLVSSRVIRCVSHSLLMRFLFAPGTADHWFPGRASPHVHCATAGLLCFQGAKGVHGGGSWDAHRDSSVPYLHCSLGPFRDSSPTPQLLCSPFGVHRF